MVRIKHRYLLLHILYPESTNPSTTKQSTPAYLTFRSPTPPHVSPGLFITHLRNSIATHFGDCGLGLTTGSMKVVYLSPATSTIIIRCPRQHYRIVWAALTYINELPGPRRGESGKPCVIQVVRVSGTIRKSEEELLRRAKRDLVRAKDEENDLGDSILGKALGGGGTAMVPASGGPAYASIEDPDDPDDMDEDSD
jgi:ribonuclease P/MRP protein subunit POP5